MDAARDSERRCLLEVVDCGSVGYYSKFWLYSTQGAGLRGAFFGDAAHTRYNRFKMSVRKAGLWSAWLEGAVLIGLRKGPWSGAAHLRTLQALAQNLSGLFQHCFSQVVKHFYNGQPPAHVESPGMQEQVWSALLDDRLLYRKG